MNYLQDRRDYLLRRGRYFKPESDADFMHRFYMSHGRLPGEVPTPPQQPPPASTFGQRLGDKYAGLALLGFLAITSIAYGQTHDNVGMNLLGTAFALAGCWFWTTD